MKTLGVGCVAVCVLFAGACAKTEKEQPARAKGTAKVTKSAVARTSPADANVTKAKAHLVGKPWHAGTVDQAMAAAAKHKKPIFLYWGAVWCPPCNSMKATVFNHPSFVKVMDRFVAVYLDGDSERAQAWGEKLKVSGYPTLLFLDPTQRELLRLSVGVTWAEFVATTDNVLARMKPLDEIIALAKAGKARKGDWQLLSSLDGYGLKMRGHKPAQVVDTLYWLANAVPKTFSAERAVATANLLVAVATTKDKAAAATITKVRAGIKPYLAAAFGTGETRKAAREMILYAADDVVGFVFNDDKVANFKQRRAALIKTWIAAARELRTHKDLPVVSRMDTLWPEVLLFRLVTPKGEVPAELRARVVQTIADDVKKMTSPYLRKAGVSGATALLRRVGAMDAARKLLDHELKTTTTPWYYMSSYATLEKKAGNNKAALAWARKARLAAKGGATKLQWTANDLRMTAALAAGKKTRMTDLIKGFYGLLLKLPDGFSGRNHRTAKSVARAIKAWKDSASVKQLITGYAQDCSKVPPHHQQACRTYFKSLLAPGKKT